jgi:DNA polymerase/3'-5' exonuclease PolX
MSIKPKLFTFQEAQAAAQGFVSMIAPYCNLVTVAGSVRRECPLVHDVDLVCFPKFDLLDGNQPDLFSPAPPEFYPTALVEFAGAKKWKFKECLAPSYPLVIKALYNGVPVELYLTEPDGKNFGALLQMRTGSAEFNRSLAVRAKRLHLEYRAGFGVFNHKGERLDNLYTEEMVFIALGLDYIPPLHRDTDFHYTDEYRKKA